MFQYVQSCNATNCEPGQPPEPQHRARQPLNSKYKMWVSAMQKLRVWYFLRLIDGADLCFASSARLYSLISRLMQPGFPGLTAVMITPITPLPCTQKTTISRVEANCEKLANVYRTCRGEVVAVETDSYPRTFSCVAEQMFRSHRSALISMLAPMVDQIRQ